MSAIRVSCLSIVALLLVSPLSDAKSYIPSSCSSAGICKIPSAYGAPKNGDEICVHQSKKEMKLRIAHWNNDLLEGAFWCADDDGVLKVETQYLHGEIHGVYKEYDRGLKEWSSETNYRNGKREGMSRTRLSDGRFLVRFYKDDKQHGYELIVDAKNHVLNKSQCEIQGRRLPNAECDAIAHPGFDKEIAQLNADAAKETLRENNRVVEKKYKNGQIKVRYTLVDGQIDGKSESFFENGNPAAIALYKKGEKYEESIYFDDGRLKQSTHFEKGMKKDQTSYFQNGKKESEWVVSGLEKWSTKYRFKEYFDNGQLAAEGERFVSALDTWGGIADGELKEYRRNGELRSISVYSKGVRIGTWKIFTGKYDIEDTYLNNKLARRIILDKTTKRELKSAEFMPDGSLKSEKIAPGFVMSAEND